MLKIHLVLLFFTFCYAFSDAQNMHSQNDSLYSFFLDTFHIQEVEIISPVSKKYQVGSKTQNFTAMQKMNTETSNLSDLISRYSPVYIKTDAGGLSSFNFRGTSSNHTSVLIGSIDINSLTLGSSNASNIPVFLFDNIDLMFGSSSATNGSGSIGGSVRLDFDEVWTKGVAGDAMGSVGSFGEYTTGAKVFTGNGRFNSVTRLFYYEKENDFKFNNTADYDWSTESYKRDKQRFASIQNKHLIQQFDYKFNEKNKVKSFVWLSNNWHEAQPNMSENTDVSLVSRGIEDQNIRTWVNYNHKLNTFTFYSGVGFVKDNNIDHENPSQSIGTHRILSEIGIKNDAKRLKYELDIKYKYITPTVYAYDDDITETHLDLHGGLVYNLTSKLKTSLNLRQQQVSRFSAPFTPAFGFNYLLGLKENSLIKLTGNIQRSYRIPTFNDRYWGQPGYEGNANINPEDGMNYELGINYTYCANELVFKFNTTYFYMDVDNWILWIQYSDRWKAENVLRVVSQGIEFHGDVEFKIGNVKFQSAANYTFNSAIRKESTSSTDKINRQIEYAPKHMANAFITTKHNDYTFTMDGSYVGRRYYNQTNTDLEDYSLINFSAFKKISFTKNQLDIGLQVNNIFATKYQNQYNYAMPERNYRISIKYNFKNNN